MRKIRKSHLFVAAAAVLILAIAGTAYASNMAFKINQVIYRSTCTLCDQWISLPANNQFIGKTFRSAGGLCDTDGDGNFINDPDDLFEFIRQQGTAADPTAIDSLQAVSCNIPFGLNPTYQPGRAVQVRPKGIGLADTSFIVVGSHAPGTQFLVRAPASQGGSGNCVLCDNWIDLLYHTTYPNLRNACDSNGDGNSAPNVADQFSFVRQQGTAFNPALVDSLISVNCAAPFGANPAMRIGKGISIRVKTTATGDILLSPPHF